MVSVELAEVGFIGDGIVLNHLSSVLKILLPHDSLNLRVVLSKLADVVDLFHPRGLDIKVGFVASKGPRAPKGGGERDYHGLPMVVGD